MWFDFNDDSTYEEESGDSAESFVDIIKHVSFKDGAEIAFVYNRGGSYSSCYEESDDDDEDDYYNSDDDNRVYWEGETYLESYDYIILLKTADGSRFTYESGNFEDSNGIPYADKHMKMLLFFQELYKTLSIANPVY